MEKGYIKRPNTQTTKMEYNNPIKHKNMKTYILIISLLFVSLLSTNTSYAQQQDSLKQKKINYLTKVLSTDQQTAKQVASIMDTYKVSVKQVITDATLSEDARRVKINGLIEEKNKKLALFLSPTQQAKIIPTTERKQSQTGK